MLPKLCSCSKINFESSWFQRLNYSCKPKIYHDLATRMTDDETYATVLLCMIEDLGGGGGVVEGGFRSKYRSHVLN